MRRIAILGSIAAAVSLLAALGSAQDSHYWTYQYGTRSNLLGGAVIGSVLDLSGTYYNPGGLSLIETDAVELLMFAKVFHYPSITLDGFGPKDALMNSTELGEAPALFAGSLPFKGLGRHWLGYSYLKRGYTKLELTGTSVSDYDFQGIFLDDISTVVDGKIYERLSEPWYGITWAYKLSEHAGIGISQYMTYRSHWLDYQIIAEALPSDNNVKRVRDSRHYKYNHYGILWKGGVTYDWMGFSLGLTATTPRIKVFGSGESLVNWVILGQDVDGDGTVSLRESGVFTAYQHAQYMGAVGILAGDAAGIADPISVSGQETQLVAGEIVIDMVDFEYSLKTLTIPAR